MCIFSIQQSSSTYEYQELYGIRSERGGTGSTKVLTLAQKEDRGGVNGT